MIAIAIIMLKSLSNSTLWNFWLDQSLPFDAYVSRFLKLPKVEQLQVPSFDSSVLICYEIRVLSHAFKNR